MRELDEYLEGVFTKTLKEEIRTYPEWLRSIGFKSDPFSTEEDFDNLKSIFVNREKELETLFKVFARFIKKPMFGLIRIEGLTGVGKTLFMKYSQILLDNFLEKENLSDRYRTLFENANNLDKSISVVREGETLSESYLYTWIEEKMNEKIKFIFLDDCHSLFSEDFEIIIDEIRKMNENILFITSWSPIFDERLKSNPLFYYSDKIALPPMPEDSVYEILIRRLELNRESFKGGAFLPFENTVLKIISGKEVCKGLPRLAIEICSACFRRAYNLNERIIDEEILNQILETKFHFLKKDMRLTESQKSVLRELLIEFYRDKKGLDAEKISDSLGITRGAVVQHFSNLYDLGFLNKDRQRRFVIYTIRDELVSIAELAIIGGI
jgi:Cdc6-like AAA superfamily ATPase